MPFPAEGLDWMRARAATAMNTALRLWVCGMQMRRVCLCLILLWIMQSVPVAEVRSSRLANDQNTLLPPTSHYLDTTGRGGRQPSLRSIAAHARTFSRATRASFRRDRTPGFFGRAAATFAFVRVIPVSHLL
jgi:hypothetical protein